MLKNIASAVLVSTAFIMDGFTSPADNQNAALSRQNTVRAAAAAKAVSLRLATFLRRKERSSPRLASLSITGLPIKTATP